MLLCSSLSADPEHWSKRATWDWKQGQCLALWFLQPSAGSSVMEPETLVRSAHLFLTLQYSIKMVVVLLENVSGTSTDCLVWILWLYVTEELSLGYYMSATDWVYKDWNQRCSHALLGSAKEVHSQLFTALHMHLILQRWSFWRCGSVNVKKGQLKASQVPMNWETSAPHAH